MTNKHTSVLAALAILGLINAPTSTAQEAGNSPLTGVDKVMMHKAARANCLANLANQVKGLSISENACIVNAFSQDVTQSSFIEALIKGAVVSDPIYVGDSCVVNGTLTLDQVVVNLKQLSTTVNNQQTQSFEEVKKYNTKSVVKATGMGTIAAPEDKNKPDGPPDDTGEIEVLRRLSGPGQYKIMALKAALLDAYANLASSLKGVKLTDQMTVNNCVGQSWTETATAAIVTGARVKRYVAVPPDMVHCTIEITLATVVENVKKNSTVFSNGREISMENIRRYNGDLVTIPATGSGAVVSNQAVPPRQSTGTGIIGEVK